MQLLETKQNYLIDTFLIMNLIKRYSQMNYKIKFNALTEQA